MILPQAHFPRCVSQILQFLQLNLPREKVKRFVITSLEMKTYIFGFSDSFSYQSPHILLSACTCMLLMYYSSAVDNKDMVIFMTHSGTFWAFSPHPTVLLIIPMS